MILARPSASSRMMPTVLLGSLAASVWLGGCAGSPRSVSVPRQQAGIPRYACPDGRGFTMQFDPTTQQTDFWLDGRLHRLLPVPDPNGGVLYQDADVQLRRGATDATDATETFTDRSTTVRQTCDRAP